MSYTNPNCTPCSTEQTVVVPCTGCSIILPDTCVIRKGAAISCLGIEVDDTLEDMIDKIAEKICAADNYVFDTTCLSGLGSVNSNIGDAINLIIAKICDSVVSYPTFNAACLGGASVETMSNTINYLITKTCNPDLSYGLLDWTCLTPPGTSGLEDILQALIDNIKSTKLTFGTGFVVSPQACGYLVEYTGAGSTSGITLTSLSASISTGTPTSYINVTPSSGVNSAYTLQPIYLNGSRVTINPTHAHIDNGNSVYGGTSPTASYVVHWNNHVSFDGILVFDSTVMTYTGWLANSPSPGVFTVCTLGAGAIPDRVKVFPGRLKLKVPALPNPGAEVPEGFCYYYNCTIVVNPLSGGATLQILFEDCADITSSLFAFDEVYGPGGSAGSSLALTADVYLSQVQYYTV